MTNSNNKFRSLFDLGFSVFPVKKGDKKPAIKWTGYQHSRPKPEEIDFWDSGDFNVGVVCGKVSNLVVIDIDSAEAQVAFDALNPPITPCVRTAKGRHYYFRSPLVELRNRVRVGDVALDVRGEGGYVVGPGSQHESGIVYGWEISPAEQSFAQLTESMLAEFCRSGSTDLTLAKGSATGSASVSGRFGAWLIRQLDDAFATLAEANEGSRNDTLNRVTFIVAQHVASANVDWEPFAERLLDAALQIGLDWVEAKATIESAWKAGSKVPVEWIKTAQAYAYVSTRDQFYHIAGRYGLSAGAFDRTHNSERTWGRGRISTVLTDQDLIEKVADLRFDPQQPTGVYELEGQRWLNTYIAPDIEAVAGDTAPIREFLEYLIPSEPERVHLERMIAWTVRNPGRKLGHALLFRSEHQGVGKSMLMEIWRTLLGQRNTRLTTTEEITGNFQSFIEGNLLVLVEELNMGFGPQGYNRIKNLITGQTAEVNEKFISSREKPNHATFAFLTNLAEPILIEDTDRRFFFVDSPSRPREPSYYAAFADWWQGNIGIVRHYFDSVDLEGFNPFAPPPETEARQRLKSASRSPLEQELLDAIDERRWPFTRDIVRLEEIRANIPAAYSATLQRLKSALRALGCLPLGQVRVPGEWVSAGGRPIFVSGADTRPSLWAISNLEFWRHADPSDWSEEFRRQKGMWRALDGMGVAVRHARSEPQIFREVSELLAV